MLEKRARNNFKNSDFALATIGWLAVSSNAWATADFSAAARAELHLTDNSGLTISVINTFLDIFEDSSGNATTAVNGQASPNVESTAGDTPTALATGESMALSWNLGATATSTILNPSSVGRTSILETGVVHIENLGAENGTFDFDLDWQWDAFVADDGDGEFASISLELIVGSIDSNGIAISTDSVFSQSLDSRNGDSETFNQLGSYGVTGILSPGESRNIVVYLDGINGIAQSELRVTVVPVPAPIAMIGTGVFLMGFWGRRCSGAT